MDNNRIENEFLRNFTKKMDILYSYREKYAMCHTGEYFTKGIQFLFILSKVGELPHLQNQNVKLLEDI